MARPKKDINWAEVESAMMASENQEEIAASQGVDRNTLSRRFYEEYEEDYIAYSARLYKKCDGLLRDAQIRSAMKGNSNMLLWLGKVRLGQKEPDGVQMTSPMDSLHALQHQIMEISNKLETVLDENRRLKTSLGIGDQESKPIQNESKAEQELLGSDTSF